MQQTATATATATAKSRTNLPYIRPINLVDLIIIIMARGVFVVRADLLLF